MDRERFVRKFLVFPKKINNKTRWLENIIIKQSYNEKEKKWKDVDIFVD